MADETYEADNDVLSNESLLGEPVKYSLDVVKDLSDEELYQRLFKCWGIKNKKIEVWGELTKQDGAVPYRLKNVRNITDNKLIEYPIDVSYGLQSGIFVYPSIGNKYYITDQRTFVRGKLILTKLSERIKHGNPFELNLSSDDIEPLEQLPIAINEIDRLSDIDKSIVLGEGTERFIDKVIYEQQLSKLKTEFEEAQKSEIETHLSRLNSMTRAVSIEKVELHAIKDSVESSKKENQQLGSESKLLRQSIEKKEHELAILDDKYKGLEEVMAKKIENLKAFIEEKAVFLKSFEFIDDEEFNSFVSNITKVSERPEHIEFSDHLNGDYKQAVSYIQAYLKERDILYPRHIIENYLTLIRSNDLIILAGDSGSGKTNLVNSFADAVGGKSIIIPVKPNWTSSEDLLGYYNPLEKKYLATPFLEALIEAQQNPEVPYFICLDEMNLARVEYYFADFLSKLEERNKKPEIQLYSDDEASHVLAELKGVVSIITGAKEKYNKNGITDFIALMQDEDVNNEMKRAFGFSDKNSLIKYHGDIRRMLAGVISTPSSITISPNVRIIGAINIDETTHYLSPKILDRAHIMKFRSPLLSDWDKIISEIDAYGFEDVALPVVFEIDELGVRTPYPNYSVNDDFCIQFKELNSRFFHPLGVEFGMRTIRQGLNYLALFKDVNEDKEQAINNFIIHKVLPKFTFDGNKKSGQSDKLDLLDKVLKPLLEEILESHENMDEEFSSIVALQSIINNAKDNDGVVNYWA